MVEIRWQNKLLIGQWHPVAKKKIVNITPRCISFEFKFINSLECHERNSFQMAIESTSKWNGKN